MSTKNEPLNALEVARSSVLGLRSHCFTPAYFVYIGDTIRLEKLGLFINSASLYVAQHVEDYSKGIWERYNRGPRKKVEPFSEVLEESFFAYHETYYTGLIYARISDSFLIYLINFLTFFCFLRPSEFLGDTEHAAGKIFAHETISHFKRTVTQEFSERLSRGGLNPIVSCLKKHDLISSDDPRIERLRKITVIRNDLVHHNSRMFYPKAAASETTVTHEQLVEMQRFTYELANSLEAALELRLTPEERLNLLAATKSKPTAT